MKKLYLISAIVAQLIFACATYAQNVNLEVRITKLERTGYSDCFGCNDPDPTWKIQSTHNGAGAINYGPFCWHYGDMAFTLWDIPDYTLMNVVNTNATTFTAGFADAFEKSCSNNNCVYESYNFFDCFPSVNGDSRRCINTSLVIENFRTFAPCQWHNRVSNFCGDFRFEYAFQWSYNTAPTITVQPVSNTVACLGDPVTLTVAAALDANGFNTGRNFQWQVSTSTACLGSGWANITNANSASYTVPPTAGTRLYRCLVTSNCNLNFATNTSTSNCAVVTYNPIGSPGDLPPDIVSGICGSTVLPGSTHSLGVLAVPNPGAVLGLTGYTWTASGGSPTNFNGQTFTWTAPVNPGSYTINLTYNDNCPQPDAQAGACVVNVGSATCDFAYVSTLGVDSSYRGGPDNPYQTLAYAISQLNGRKYIRMATGTYFETNVLQLEDNLVIEGGYRVNGNIWSKTNSDSTTIVGLGSQTINADVAHRVAFVADNDDNWTLQDLVITTTNTSNVTANNKGFSNYSVLAINGSSGFQIVRCKIYTGNAAKGVNGTTPSGSGGAGGGGTGGGGGGGSNTRCNGSGGGGTAGNSGNGGASGGGFGPGCGGSGCNVFGCNAGGCTASNGLAGNQGAPGTSFPAGSRPATPGASTPYYTPAGQSASGTSGFGGGGGGGGGGGDIGSCCTCSCGSGTPNGGGGGTGGGGGLPGSGGFGGGGSFGVYTSGAGTSGSLTSSYIIAGSAGLGGDGASGQPGAVGAAGGNGVDHGGCDGGRGGNGGSGGRGGDGGRGEDGANGLALAVVGVGGATITGSSTVVPNPIVIGINYQNTKACINSEIEMTKASGVWSFPSGLNLVNDLRDNPAGFPVSSYNSASNPVLVTTSTPNTALDLTVNGVTYNQFLRVAADNRQLPVITVVSPTICINGTDTFTATRWGTEVEYDWRVYTGTSVNSPLYQSTLPSPVINFFGFNPGIYVVRYRVREACCGWSKPVFDTLRIVSEPEIFNVTGGGNYCPGTNGNIVSLSGSEPGVTYVLFFDGTPVDTVVGAGGPINFAPQTGVGNYTITASRFAGCVSTMYGAVSIGQFPLPQVFNVSGDDTICQAGQNTTAVVRLDGSELGVNYQLVRNGNIPIGAAIPGTNLPIEFAGINVAGVYSIDAVSSVTGCRTSMNDSAVIIFAPLPAIYNVTGGGGFCAGTAGAVIGLDNSETGTTYQVLQGGILPVGPTVAGTGSAINFAPVNVPAYYKVRATTASGCEFFMNDSVVVTALQNPVITGVSKTDVSCNGVNNGTITISASSTNGVLNYSIDSATTFLPNNSFTGLATGNFHVYVRDASGCETRYPANPIVISQPTEIVVGIESLDSIYCNGASNGAIRISVYGGTPAYTYSWSNGSTFEDINQIPSGTYSVSVTDTKSCSATFSVTLPQPSQLLSVATVPVNVRCFSGNDGRVTISISGGTQPYEYYLNGVYQSDSVFTGLSAGFYSVQAKDANGCIAAANFSILQPQAFYVNAGPDVIAVRGMPVTLNGTATSASGIIGYTWTPALGLSCVECQSTIATPDSNQVYVLMAMDGDSCLGFDSVEVIIKREPSFFIPTAFTPNADGLNDYFEFDILGAKTASVQIFNRWGEKVYDNPAQVNGFTNGNAWDGKTNGKLQPYDTYVYQLAVLFYDDSIVERKGTITIMR
jgi:gliding motility-associated-like protein